MSDDLNKKIKQITDILGQEGLPDNLKGLLGMLTGSSESKEEQPSRENESSPRREETGNRSELEDSVEMMRKVTKIMERMKSTNDPRINLLSAVRPFLNGRRQRRVNDCIKLLQMSKVTKLLDEGEKGFF